MQLRILTHGLQASLSGDTCRTEMKKISLIFLLSLVAILNVHAQMVTDTFISQYMNNSCSSHTLSAGQSYIKEWVKYGPSKLAQRGIVPGTVIYGVSYYKNTTGYFLSTAQASLEVKYRSGSTDSTIPYLANGPIPTNGYYTNYLTTGFASWTTFYLGSNLTIPAAPGWIPPLLADVPFVYTGGSLEICTKWQTTLNSSNGGICIFYENTGLPAPMLVSLCLDPNGNPIGGAGTRPATIIYHSGPPPACSGMPSGGHVTGVNNVCKNQDFTLYLYNPSAGPGINYQWQKSSINPISWSNISGATAPSITSATITPQLYRCKVTCANSGHTAISDSFAITPHFYQIDSVLTPIAGNMLTILPYDNDTTFPVFHNYLTSNWDTLFCDTPPCNTPPFTKHFTTDGTYNLVYVCGNLCNLDTAYGTITIGCLGSPTFHDSISSNQTTCSANPTTLSLLDTLPANYTTQWQAYLNFQWTTLTGLTAPSITVNPTVNTIYRNKSTCNLSGNFKYSNNDTVWVTPPPIAGTIQATNTSTNYYNFTNNGMSNAQSYVWYFGDGDSSTSLAPTHHYGPAGTYTVHFVATNAGNGCTDTATTTVHITTGIEDPQNKLFSVSPNPFNESFTVTCPAAKGTLTIVDAIGKVVKSVVVKSGNTTIDMKGFATGIYLIKYENEGQFSTQKIIKQ